MFSNSQIRIQVSGEDGEKEVVAGVVSILEGSYPFLSQEIFSVHPQSIAAMMIATMMEAMIEAIRSSLHKYKHHLTFTRHHGGLK